MDENEGLELAGDGESSTSSSSRSVRKNIPLKLKQSPAKRGRGKKGGRGGRASKATKKKQEPEPEETLELADDYDGPSLSSLRPAGPPEPMHQNKHLKWDHKVNLIGEKMVDPLIHCCEKCSFPILVYGRMIPCKHVFCMNCAKTIEKNCARCSEQVHRIEQSAVGSVFMCTFGGSKNGVSGCRRTYLSPRDLQAHIKHRHLKEGAPPPVPAPAEYKTRSAVAGTHPDMMLPKKGVPGQLPDPALFQPRVAEGLILGHGVPGQVSSSAVPGAPGQLLATSAGPESYRTIPVMSTSRGNLITVPIQDERREGPPTEFVAGTFPTHIQQQPPPGPNPYPQGPPPVMFPAGSHAPVPISAPPPFSASNPPPPLNHPPRQPPLGSNAPTMSHPSSRAGVPQPHYSTSRPPFEGSPTFSPSGGHSPRPPWSAQGTGPQHRGPPPPGQNVPPPIQGPPPQRPSYY